MRIIILQFILIFTSLAYAGDGLRLVPYRRDRVRFRAEELEPQAVKIRAVTPTSQVLVHEKSCFMNPELMIANEISRWFAGSVAEAPIRREPFAAGSLGRWVSFGGMTMPRVQVSKFTGLPVRKVEGSAEKRD